MPSTFNYISENRIFEESFPSGFIALLLFYFNEEDWADIINLLEEKLSVSNVRINSKTREYINILLEEVAESICDFELNMEDGLDYSSTYLN